jgi:DNA-binding transcriptional LysR family regulator
MLPATEGAIYNMVASWLATRGIKAPTVEVETTSVFATIEMLNHSTLLSILPKNVAKAYAELGKVALVPSGDLSSNFPVGIIYRMEAAANPMMKIVLEAARECVD